MRSAPELARLIQQLYVTETSGGLFDFAELLYSRQDCVLLIGSEPNDCHEGYEEIIRFYHETGAARLEIRVNKLKTYQEGGFGWVIDQVIVKLPSGIEVPVRHTYLFHREDDGWKIVHAHISVGVSDESLGA
jgi:ketosteroid isomerase-like protein